MYYATVQCIAVLALPSTAEGDGAGAIKHIKYMYVPRIKCEVRTCRNQFLIDSLVLTTFTSRKYLSIDKYFYFIYDCNRKVLKLYFFLLALTFSLNFKVIMATKKPASKLSNSYWHYYFQLLTSSNFEWCHPCWIYCGQNLSEICVSFINIITFLLSKCLVSFNFLIRCSKQCIILLMIARWIVINRFSAPCLELINFSLQYTYIISTGHIYRSDKYRLTIWDETTILAADCTIFEYLWTHMKHNN